MARWKRRPSLIASTAKRLQFGCNFFKFFHPFICLMDVIGGRWTESISSSFFIDSFFFRFLISIAICVCLSATVVFLRGRARKEKKKRRCQIFFGAFFFIFERVRDFSVNRRNCGRPDVFFSFFFPAEPNSEAQLQKCWRRLCAKSTNNNNKFTPCGGVWNDRNGERDPKKKQKRTIELKPKKKSTKKPSPPQPSPSLVASRV